MMTTRIALVGNPNAGKTSIFNLLTGTRQKVANYAGVTVERKEGVCVLDRDHAISILDLPGAYSLDATSPDEAITRAVCLGELTDEPLPDVLVCVLDATNLRLHLRFALETLRLGRPTLIALSMMDAAEREGICIDVEGLSQALGTPVIPTSAKQRHGLDKLKDALRQPIAPAQLPVADGDEHDHVRTLMANHVQMPIATHELDDALDRVLLHPVFGLVILAALMFLMFQAVFAWAAPFMDGLEAIVAMASDYATNRLPESFLKSFLTDAVFAGLGGVVVFLPQILILFFFILVLEESGYLPRSAFLLDRLMFKAGLSGRAFIPLLSSFACAVPGIMATRSIADDRDRLTTIMVAPLMTCSARLPVYTLLIAALIPNQTVGGLFNLQGLVLFSLYLGGIVSAIAVVWVMKLLNRSTTEHSLLLELPSYRLPDIRNIAIGLFERMMIFLKRVGGIIFTVIVLLWFLSTFPLDSAGMAPPIEDSFAGQIGLLLAPIFAPLGFGWQIAIALIPAMAAREVVVAALGTVYAMSGDEAEIAQQLSSIISSEWGLATGLALLVWFIFAPQCLSTLATVKRETQSWRLVGIMTGYLFGLAYIAAFITYQVSTWLLAA